MNLEELIAALTKLQTMCDGETDTEVLAVGLRIITVVKTVFGEDRRMAVNLITVSSCIKNSDSISSIVDDAFDVDLVR